MNRPCAGCGLRECRCFDEPELPDEPTISTLTEDDCRRIWGGEYGLTVCQGDPFGRPIPGCPGYSASSDGRIRNEARGYLKGSVDRYGYRYVNLTLNGETAKRKVHRLVCEAWHGSPPTPEHQAAHLDGDRLNNTPENLTWATAKENNAHKIQHGTHQAGAKHPGAKLSPEQVEQIRASELPTRAIAQQFGIGQTQVVRIRTGQQWAAPSRVSPSRPSGDHRYRKDAA